MALFLAICAIAWAIAAEMRISNYRSRSYREREDLKARQAEIASLSAKNEALSKSNGELLDKARSAKQEEDVLRNKLTRAFARSISLEAELEESRQNYPRSTELAQEAREKLEAELEESRQNYTRSTELVQEAREKLEAETKARKQAVAAYFKLEAGLYSSDQNVRSESATSVDSASYMAIQEQRCESNLDIFSDTSASYAIIDVETTGFSDDDDIVEVAVIKVDSKGRVSDRFETTIRSTKDSSRYALEAHRLDTEILCQSPGFEEISHAIANCLDGRIIVAHNLSFDLRFLDRAFKKVEGLVVDFGQGIDTLYGGEAGTKIKLENLCKEYNLSYQSHSAMGDAEALLSLLVFGAIKPPISGQESVVKVVGLMRPGDCELRPRSMLPAKASRVDSASILDPELNPNPFSSTSFIKGSLITLEAGDKVCCSCSSRTSKLRDTLYAKHAELGLESPRSISSRHKCIVVEDFSSTAVKVLQARQLEKLFVRAEDFIQYQEGGLLQTWVQLPGT